MTSHSIAMLKQKFDEIKRNINTIEMKQREFFAYGAENKFHRSDRPNRPASASRIPEAKPCNEKTDELIRKIQDLQIENQFLSRKLDEKIKENQSLVAENRNQDIKLRELTQENQQLKKNTENSSFQEKRPQSCIRDTKSPSKKTRVAFSKDLVSVHHIDSEKPLVRDGGFVMPENPYLPKYGAHKPFNRNGFSEKYISEDLYRYRRMGMD